MRLTTITRPDDWHVHLRDGAGLQSVIQDSTKFGNVLVMPNLDPPIVNLQMAIEYQKRVLSSIDFPELVSHFRPWMTIYLTDSTSVQDIYEATKSGIVKAAKLYPANATTNSAKGVTNIDKLDAIFAAMQECGIILCIHGELLHDAKGEIDIFKRESAFISEKLYELVDTYPKLKIVLEHITTHDAVEFVMHAREDVSATITAHHLLENRNALFRGGIQPHNYCLPILKKESDRESLLLAATSGNKKFFAGSDSAPHAQSKKESACGCAGCYTALHAIELYATAFETLNALDKLEGFMSFYGADFYRVPRNTDTITLIEEEWVVPEVLEFTPNQKLIPFYAGKTLFWKVKG